MKKKLLRYTGLLSIMLLSLLLHCKKDSNVEPKLKVADVKDILFTSVTCGGSIINGGGAPVTSYGVCWATTQNPTTANSKTNDGSGLGSFVSHLNGLTAGTTYYVRAYATNSLGTGYSDQKSFTTQTLALPVITTTAVSAITSSSATSGGNVTSDGGAAVTTKGVCWSTTTNPTTANSKTINGTGLGAFTSSITGLASGTNYYVRAYATNSVGTAYGNEVTFSSTAIAPVVTTAAISSITPTTAASGGNVTSDGGAAVTSRGVCWSTTTNPTTALSTKTSDGTGTGAFTSSITGLTEGITYYVRAYATNSIGTTYGTQVSFKTLAFPVLTTTVISSITSTTAISGGNVTSDGGAAVTSRGVCWSTITNPTTELSTKTSNGTGTGTFASSITGLTSNTTYYVRAYATNSAGTAYGNELTFKTSAAPPTLSTITVTGITQTTASGGGNITSDGGAAVTTRGVCWSTATGPTTSNSKTLDGTGAGSFSSNLIGLTASTTYYVRAYATNSAGTAYGNELIFTSGIFIPVVPTLTTASVTGITQTTASGGGLITSDGGSSVTTRGVCWSTVSDPTTSDSKTTNGTGSGSFVSNLTGLLPGTTYHVRAYATNSAGTGYGTDITFTTTAIGVPTLTTSTATSIGLTTAVSGGNITSDGGAVITARGTCWSTTANPTIFNSITSDGIGSGIFVSNLIALLPGTTYYARAYATNSAGTAYGNNITFTTPSAGFATLTTTAVTSITLTSAVSGGNITADGGATIIARGVCWSTIANPTILNSLTSNGTGTGGFVSNLTALLPGTTYHVRAYATNSAGTAYGNDLTFTTTSVVVPTLTTTAVTAITSTTAVSGGNISTDGGGAITARGVCWTTSANPTIINSKTSDGTGTGTFVSNLTALLPNTTYYARAYATNSAGTAYGNQVVFTTINANLALITTTVPSAITQTTATSGGNCTSNGGSLVSVKGVCWSTSANPTIALVTKTADDTGTGSYVSYITALSPNTTYHVRAYATNSVGTGYGNDIIFKTFTGTTTDIDGNVYNTVTIGTQVWMAENLKTARYNNNTTIPLVTGTSAWATLTTPAYCWYNNDAATYKATYGALYNWYAMDAVSNGGKNVCPAGWHAPDDAEWTILSSYLGGEGVAGDQLKESGLSHWFYPNSGTNTSGFLALPGGDRSEVGVFSSINAYGTFWSSSSANIGNAWFRSMSNNLSSINRDWYYKQDGFSVRCLKDN